MNRSHPIKRTFALIPALASASHDDPHRLPVQFDERVLFECGNDLRQMPLEQRREVSRSDVACANEQQFPGLRVKNVRMVKVRVLGDDDALFLQGKRVEDLVRRSVLRGQLAGVDGVVSRRLQQGAQARRQVRVQHEIHLRTRWRLLSLSDCAANSRHACRSSSSRSGNSNSKFSNVSPAARYSSMDSTGYRKWRMAGFPWQMSGSIVMRERRSLIIDRVESRIHRLSNDAPGKFGVTVQNGVNIGARQFRVATENRIPRFALGQLLQDSHHRDSRAFDNSLTVTDARIDFNSVAHALNANYSA